MPIRIKQTILFIGDVVLLYGCLFVTLTLRYGSPTAYISDHLGPFSVIFALWITIFYIAGLYDNTGPKRTLELAQKTFVAVGVGAILAIVLFYLIPYFKISPKTNLALFSGIFVFVFFGWRFLFSYISRSSKRSVLVIGSGPDVRELIDCVHSNPHWGYAIAHVISDAHTISSPQLLSLIKEYGVSTIVISSSTDASLPFLDGIFKSISSGIEVLDLTTAYELLMRKVPLGDVERLWMITSVSKSRRIYESIKRPTELVTATLLFVILFPVLIVLYLLVTGTSRGGGIYRQTRVGKNEHLFTIYKFRTMVRDAEAEGAQWAQGNNDPRITTIGRVLRRLHLDELPQLLNIIRGDLSFVGPRPERPEFVADLKKHIPYYDARHLIKPGVTGWAQINFRYGASIEDAYTKLQYDIYYIKHRSFTLDILIALKTLNSFLIG